MEEVHKSSSSALLSLNAEADPSTKPAKVRLTCMLATSVFASVIGSSFQFGFQTGVLNNPQQLLQDEYQYAFAKDRNGTEAKLTDEQVTLYWSLTVSLYAVGGMIAGFTGSYFATTLGRKKMMLLNNIVLMIGVALMVMARYIRLFELIITGRLILGIHSGFSTVVAPLYLNEISPVNLRGGVGTLHQLGVTLGILISQILGLQQIFGNVKYYHLLFGTPAVAGLLQLLTLPMCPESPSWLYITKLKVEESRKALCTLWGKADVEHQLSLYAAEVNAQKNRPKVTFGMMFRLRHLRNPLIIAVVMQLSQQWSGIIAVLNYSTSIFKSVGLAETSAQYSTIGTTGAIVSMTILGVLFVDQVGRKPLHLGGLSGCLITMVLLTIALFIQVSADWAKYMSIVALVLFIISFAIGPGSIPWFITAELFDQASRPYAISLATLVNWTANFSCALLFPLMQEGIGNYVFIPFIVLLILFVLFTFFKVPETKNKSTEEIVSLFKKGKTDNEDVSPL
ncbi:solute carrier family 2, facilitated glucose transporter member 1-like [Watersipora subatra]|uniref:solute carrier family 2, facilitated glucose transporter member 1-like n=1 Tax=Watersipora subatra TaxID=2589382 RepID=UPI00355B87F2